MPDASSTVTLTTFEQLEGSLRTTPVMVEKTLLKEGDYGIYGSVLLRPHGAMAAEDIPEEGMWVNFSLTTQGGLASLLSFIAVTIFNEAGKSERAEYLWKLMQRAQGRPCILLWRMGRNDKPKAVGWLPNFPLFFGQHNAFPYQGDKKGQGGYKRVESDNGSTSDLASEAAEAFWE